MPFTKGQKPHRQFGVSNGNSKYHPRLVSEIRRMGKRKIPQIEIARRVKCSTSYVSRVLAGKLRARK